MKHLKIFVLSHIRIFFLICCVFLFANTTFCIDAKIVFCMDGDIYVMNDDGSKRRRLTRNTKSYDIDPRWSPDGKRIAFARKSIKIDQDTYELYVMNADGTDLQRLTHDKVIDIYPDWSPDGNRIAFTSGRSGRFEVHVIELATLTVTQLTGIEGEKGAAASDWSPDGTQIVYEKLQNVGPGFYRKDIYLMSANGENQRHFFPDPNPRFSMQFHPRWSSDGQQVVFVNRMWKGEQRIRQLIVAQIGGETQEIKELDKKFGINKWQIAVADWMDNDRSLVFALRRMNNPAVKIYNLYKYDFETGNIKQLTRDMRDEKYPDWIGDQLSVSPKDKLPTQWGKKRQDLSR